VDEPVNLYDSHYDRVEAEVYRAIRREAYGEDLGQTSWITAEEASRFCDWLGLRAGHRLLEVACGSGGVAAWIAETTGAHVVGIDVNVHAIEAARRRSPSRPSRASTEFQVVDADAALPFGDASFDAVFCNDAILHLRDQLTMLGEWRRILHASKRCLYTDPVVVTKLVSKDELAARSSIGFFTFSAPGVNERLLAQAGFSVARSVDLTEAIVRTSRRWRDARQARCAELVGLEGNATFEGLQHFLGAVHTLAAEGRLSRVAFVGERGDAARAG